MTICTTIDRDEIWFEGIELVDELLDSITNCIVTFTSTIEICVLWEQWKVVDVFLRIILVTCSRKDSLLMN